MQVDSHIFTGMRRDNHPIKQDKNFLWDAHNIRLTTRDNNTMLSITNEKSTEHILTFNRDQETYIGHCVLGKYLVVFTHNDDAIDPDAIYRISISSDSYELKALYLGNLGLSPEFPIQAIGSFESELIQKVYWVDGKNQPRVINIALPELLKERDPTFTHHESYSTSYKDAPFDFVQELDLKETLEVSRLPNGSGIFPAGVIQYVFTYFHKYGQESNIVDTSELLYISHPDRGGSPEDNISTAFKITIQNPQTDFSNLRIYSIIRTSIDAVPTVKRVVDIELGDIRNTEITYIDDGRSGDIIDPTLLLYIGGKDIVANCIESKDNVLFLGDIEYKRREPSTIKEINNAIKSSSINNKNFREVTIKNVQNGVNSNGFYDYTNQLSGNTSTFKVGETYRLGLQFQYKNGEWSEPFYLKDLAMESSRPTLENGTLKLPCFSMSLDEDIENTIKNKGYVRVRPMIVIPSQKDRTVLAQGILCPTVFNSLNRRDNTPFAQSSWLLRPFCTRDPNNASTDYERGSIAEFRHLYPLLTGLSRGAEIQNMYLNLDDNSDEDIHLSKTKEVFETNGLSHNSIYYVDQSILTFHSPDLEFDDTLMPTLSNDSNNFTIKLVGVVPFSSNYGDISIQTSSVQADPDAAGYMHRTIFNSLNGDTSLISGLFYDDNIIATDDKGNFMDLKTYTKQEKSPIVRPRSWMTHMWHRSGSLNNDSVRPSGQGSRTAELSKKIISNIKYSEDNKWLTNAILLEATSKIHIFNSNEIDLIKIKDDKNLNGSITYYGNVDTINPSYTPFNLVAASTSNSNLKITEHTFTGKVSVEGDYSFSTIEGGSSTPSTIEMSISVNNITGDVKDKILQGIVTNDDTLIVISKTPNESGTLEPIIVQLKDATIDIKITNTMHTHVPDTSKFSGTITTLSGVKFKIEGDNDYIIEEVENTYNSSFNFRATVGSLAKSPYDYAGKYHIALKTPKDPVRIKYKSTPHVVFANKYNNGAREPLPILKGTYKGEDQGDGIYWLKKGADEAISSFSNIIELSQLGINECPSSYLWLAEIHQYVNDKKRYGGTSAEALQANVWIPAGKAARLDTESEEGKDKIWWIWGDTWYQRYDCLKTYPFTQEDENQVIEIGSFMCETRVNIDGRYDRNRGQMSNLYMSPINFNKINPVYSQKNTFFTSRILDKDYYLLNRYPSQVMWTLAKSPGGINDAWTNITTANSLDLDGSKGKINAIVSYNDMLFGFQDTAVQNIQFNSRVQINASDGVPIEIANSQRVDGYRIYSDGVGCQDKFSVINTPYGIYFMDNIKHGLYSITDKFTDLGTLLGTLYWARENVSDDTWHFDPQVDGMNGVRLYYDSKFNDIYFTPGTDKNGTRDALCYSQQLQAFSSFLSYGGAVMFSMNSKFYSIARDAKTNALTLWENFPENSSSYNNIFNDIKNYGFSFISNDNPNITKIFDNIEMRADCYEPNNNAEDNYGLLGDDLTHVNQTGKPFDTIRVDNEYQDTGDRLLDNSSMRKKFRIWRAIIPRKKGTRERIRNPWAKITLEMQNPGNKMTILHDLNVGYTI